jgi:hypothetical protein
MRVLLLVLLLACDPKGLGGGVGLDLPLFDVVYECGVLDAVVELCFEGSAEELERELAPLDANVMCWPTERHLGVCVHRCPPAAGCNATHACWCG